MGVMTYTSSGTTGLMLENCPFCGGIASMETPMGEARARGCCTACGAKGPMAGTSDARAWNVAAAEEWNVWAVSRRRYP